MDLHSPRTWLDFSLSPNNHQHYDFLLQAFSAAPHYDAGALDQETDAATALAALAAGIGAPKLEDFLGVGGPLGRYSFAEADYYDHDLKTVSSPGFGHCLPLEQNEPQKETAQAPEESRKAVDTFGQRTSIYRGVTRYICAYYICKHWGQLTRSVLLGMRRHRWTGRYEAHLWDNSCRREGQSRKGRQGTRTTLIK